MPYLSRNMPASSMFGDVIELLGINLLQLYFVYTREKSTSSGCHVFQSENIVTSISFVEIDPDQCVLTGDDKGCVTYL